jgi:hypothetical protein
MWDGHNYYIIIIQIHIVYETLPNMSNTILLG